VVHNRLPSTAGPQASTLPNWFTASYLPQSVDSHLTSLVGSQLSSLSASH